MILFKIAGGEIVPEIEMSLLYNRIDLKQKVRKVLDVEVYRQSLCYNNIVVRDHELLHSYGFGASETASSPHYHLNTISVKVKFVGSYGYVMVKETNTVSELHSKLESQWGIPSALSLLKHQRVVMKDNLPVSAYYFNEAAEVQLSV